MHDPPHPGAFIRRQCLEPLGLTVTEAAALTACSFDSLAYAAGGEDPDRRGRCPEIRLP